MPGGAAGAPPGRDGGREASTAGEGEEVTPEQREREDAVLRRAVGARAALKAQVVGLREPPPEPGRLQSHWDFVLLEMAWMSNDFAQERHWKMAQARRVARRAAHKAREKGLGAAPEKKVRGGGGRKTRASARGADEEETEEKDGASNGVEPESPGTPEPSDGPAAAFYFECDGSAADEVFREAEAQEALRLEAARRRAVDFEAQLGACRKAVALAARVAEAEQERTLLLRARDERLAAAQAVADAEAAEEARLLGLKAVKRKKGKKDEGETADEFTKRMKLDGEGILGEDLPLNLGDDLIKPKKKKKKKADLLAGTSLDRPVDPLALGLDGLPLPKPKKSKKKKADPLALGPDGKPLKGSKKKADGAGWKKGKGKKAAMGLPSAAAEVPWTVLEDQLLCALVHEFTANWKLVSDVLSSCLSLRGLYRRADQCKYRFRLVTRAASSGDAPQEELVIGGMKLNKASARLLLQNCTPTDEDTLKGHLDALCQVGAKFKTKPEKMDEAKALKEVHQSHALTQNMAHGHRPPLGPLELCEMAFQMGSAPPPAVGGGGPPPGMGVPQPGMPPGQGYAGMSTDPGGMSGADPGQMGMHGAARLAPGGHQGYPGMIPGGGHSAIPMHAGGAGVGGGSIHGGRMSGAPGGGGMSAAALALQTGKHPVSGQPLTESQRQQIYAHLQAQRAGGAQMGSNPHAMPGIPQQGMGRMAGRPGGGGVSAKGSSGAKSHKKGQGKGAGKTSVAKGGVQKVSHKKGQGKAAMAKLAAAKAKGKK